MADYNEMNIKNHLIKSINIFSSQVHYINFHTDIHRKGMHSYLLPL